MCVLCLIVTFIWWSETVKCDKNAKNYKINVGQWSERDQSLESPLRTDCELVNQAAICYAVICKTLELTESVLYQLPLGHQYYFLQFCVCSTQYWIRVLYFMPFKTRDVWEIMGLLVTEYSVNFGLTTADLQYEHSGFFLTKNSCLLWKHFW